MACREWLADFKEWSNKDPELHDSPR